MELITIMDEINNCFEVNEQYDRSKDISFNGKDISGTFTQDYITGQYIRVVNSVLNDGAYKIESIAQGKITIDKDLQTENSNRLISIYGLAVPNDFITLATEIIQYGKNDNIKSETVSRYSVTYGDSGGAWNKVYASALSKWRKMRWC